MLLPFLCIFLGTMVLAEVPPYIKVCGLQDPNLNECVRNSVEGLRPILQSGIPELNVSMEPMTLEAMQLFDTQQLKIRMTHINLHGLSNFKINQLNFDQNNKEITMNLGFERINIDADYDFMARILFGAMKSHGRIYITTNDVSADITLQYALYQENGMDYFYFSAMTTKLYIKDYVSKLTPADGGNGEFLETMLNSAVGGNQENIRTLTPHLEYAFSVNFLQLANNFCRSFTYDELFPNRV